MTGFGNPWTIAALAVAAAVCVGSGSAQVLLPEAPKVSGPSTWWGPELIGFATSSFLLQGALIAVEIAALAMVGGAILGLGLALLRLSPFAPVRAAAWTYIWFVRGTPQLLQLVFLYDALPPIGIKLDAFTTAVIGFALNEAAFSAEIIRGGILSVNRNQTIAAAAFGMGRFLTLRRIILPQAMRAILPAMANETIAMIKGTSIASVIFVNELTFRAQQIVGQNFKFFTVFAAAGIIYLVLTSVVAGIQWLLERRYNLEIDRQAGGRSIFDRMLSFRLGIEREAASAPARRSPHPQPRPARPLTSRVRRGSPACHAPRRRTGTRHRSWSAATSTSLTARARCCAAST